MKKKLHALTLILLLPLWVVAQNGKISGVIRDKDTKEPLLGAIVRVTASGQLKGGAVANEDGEYTVSPLTPGSYDIEFSLLGYGKITTKNFIVHFETSSRLDGALSSRSEQLDEVVIEATDPLISADETSTGTKLSAKDIAKLPTRNVNAVLATTAGVFSNDDGGELNVRGNRGSDNIVFVNGVRQFGNAYPPVETIAEISVITGGVPAQYGDALGGIISVTTKGAAERTRGGIQFETSSLFDKWNYNLAGLNYSGPVLRKRTMDAVTGKESVRSIIGNYSALQFTYNSDNDPSAYGYLQLNDDVRTRLETTPLVRQPLGTYTSTGNFLTEKDFNRIQARPNSAGYDLQLNTTFDYQPKENITVSFGGTFNYGKKKNLGNDNFANQLFNSDRNNIGNTFDGQAFIRFRQTFNNPSRKDGEYSLKNFYYQLQADYTRTYRYISDPRFGKNIELYNYAGKFTDKQTLQQSSDFSPYYYLYAPGSNQPIDSVNVDPATNGGTQYFTRGSVLNQGFNGQFGYEAYDQNPLIGNINKQILGTEAELGGFPKGIPYLQFSSLGGVYNGQGPQAIGYNTQFASPGSNTSFAGYDVRDQYRFSAQVAGDIGKHTIKVGGEFEQRVISQWGGLPGTPWVYAPFLVNGHILSSPNIGTTLTRFEQRVGTDGSYYEIVPDLALNLDGDGNLIGQTDYDRRLRRLLNVPNNELINVQGLDTKYLNLSNFTVSEILGDGTNSMVSGWQGYTPYGNRSTGRSNYFDFFTDTINRPIDSWRPIYTAGFIEDKFEIKDLIVRIGFRFDQFDANTPVLRDRYSTTRLTTVGETDLSKFNNGTFQRPSTIGNDYAVYVSKTADNFLPSRDGQGGNENEYRITGFRNGNTFYNANGQEVENYREVASSGAFFPLYDITRLNDQQRRIQQQTGLTQDAFQDFKGQLNIMPRIAFSFPISEDALFFAHYDILTQRPQAVVGNGRSGPILLNQTGDIFTNPIFYYLFKRSNGSFLPNPNLNPQKKIDYQLGFQQRLSSNSALKLSAFYSEIKDLIQVVNVLGGYPTANYTTNGNQDFGVVKGMIVQYDYRKKGGSGLGLNASYSLQFAEGSASDFAAALLNTATPNLRNIAPANWDQRHATKLNIDYRFNKGDGPSILGVNPFENGGINLTFNAGSGLPYSKIGTPFGARQQIEGSVNGARLPWNNRTGARIDKTFYFKGIAGNQESSLNIYLYVSNLFDQRNVLNVYRRTGSATDDGYLRSDFGQNQISQPQVYDKEAYAFYYNYTLLDPDNVSAPRRFRIGVSYSF